MSDDLVKRLRAEIFAGMGPNGATYSEEPVVFYEEAAAALVAKDAEIARLREALQNIAAEATVPVSTWQNGINFKKMYEGWRKLATIRVNIARAALNTQHKGETS